MRRIVQTHALATTLSIAAPPLAAVASFLVYAALHDGDIGSPANIFSSFALFQWLQSPLELLPMIFSAIVDVREASKRIEKVYNARTAQERQTLAESSPFAIDFSAASFQWDSSPSQDAEMPKRLKSRRLVEKLLRRKQEEEKSEPAIDLQTPLRPFALSGIDLKVKRGQLVAVVGPVASGKSSLCGGLLGHMTRMNGYAAMGASLASCVRSRLTAHSRQDRLLFANPLDPIGHDQRECTYGSHCVSSSHVRTDPLRQSIRREAISKGTRRLLPRSRYRFTTGRRLYSELPSSPADTS